MMSFMGSSGKGFKEEEEEEEEEEEIMRMSRSSSSGKLPISNLSSSSSSHLQHTGQYHQQRVAMAGAVGNWPLENKSDHHRHHEQKQLVTNNIEVEREHMFDKVVTPSDVGKLNRLVIPKQYAEKYFPLDSSINEKGLLLNFDDRNGKPWRFRYSYWNSSQSYVMTKGWSRFVKEKKLDAGDVVSFHRGVGDLSKHRLFIDWRRRCPPTPTPTTTTLDPFLIHHHHHHHHNRPPLTPSTTTLHSFPTHYFSYTRSSSGQLHQYQQQQYHPPHYYPYPWRSRPGQLLQPPPSPPPPPPPTTTTTTNSQSAAMASSSRDQYSQYLTLQQPSTENHSYNYGYMTNSISTSSTVANNNNNNNNNNNINPTYSGYLRSVAPPQQEEEEAGVGMMMMMMEMPKGGPDDDDDEEEEEGGVLDEPFVLDSVPVVVQGKVAAAAKRLRLFGVNMEYSSPIEDDIEEEQENFHHHHHHHDQCHILSSTGTTTTINHASMPPQHSSSSIFPLQSRLYYNGIPVPTMPSHLLEKGKSSMSLDLDI